ncbi:aminotransferase class V-fold PLP-dependent enzyme [Anatilimnocola sp. NA78]|uniref:aminotransferase class V-fold PLP-dependent enzyme n=1 Tax=Anatilimnocola sp. NA78 TaxID=3415683 RepID=UPI003CE53315
MAAEMSRALSEPYSNPFSSNRAGVPARDAVERARSQVAGLLSCDATEVVFTSGGTQGGAAA